MTHHKQHSRAAVRRARRKSRSLLANLGAAALVLVLAAALWMVFSGTRRAGEAPEGPELVGTKQYAAAPPMTIDPSREYTATVVLAKGGEFVIQLLADQAPLTVNSFVFLARAGYFDGVTFHRVLEGFMAQTGDPTGTGAGGPGYEFVNEANGLSFDRAGVVAMANHGRDTNGSQFFITFGPQPQLNGDYTIFGQVTSGMESVNGLTRRDPSQNPSYPGDTIESITIQEP